MTKQPEMSEESTELFAQLRETINTTKEPTGDWRTAETIDFEETEQPTFQQPQPPQPQPKPFMPPPTQRPRPVHVGLLVWSGILIIIGAAILAVLVFSFSSWDVILVGLLVFFGVIFLIGAAFSSRSRT